MRHAALLSVVVLAVCLGGVALPTRAQIKPPADFTFPQAGSPGPVTFSHETHLAKVEKCTACHAKLFKMKRGGTGALTMANMREGEQCGACHNGRTTISGVKPFSVEDKPNCEKCHRK